MSVVSYVKGRFPLSEVIDPSLGSLFFFFTPRLANAYFEKFKPWDFKYYKIMYLMAHDQG